jgi:hypothetical protein
MRNHWGWTILAGLAALLVEGSCRGGGGSARSEPTTSVPYLGGLASGLGAAQFAGGELDATSLGGTITFQQIGASGWYPRVADPAVGPCDVTNTSSCCRNTYTVSGDQLAPWDEELILSLRGPVLVKQLAVYQPDQSDASTWRLVSAWDSRAPAENMGLAFAGDGTETAGFSGAIGTECMVNVSTSLAFACGKGSSPYCPASSSQQYYGWQGSKLFVLLAEMPHAGSANAGTACSTGTTGGWYDASWVGLSVGELVRAGQFSSCQCYAKDTSNGGAKADGCGQFNVFEVVNDNDSYRNLGVFSTDFVDYSGYVGEGPCGPQCDVSSLADNVDLINKATDTGAVSGVVASPTQGPGVAFRRPAEGYRYLLVLLDLDSRTVQLTMIHPDDIPSSTAALLPGLPAAVPQSTIAGLLGLRLPN